MWNMGSVVERSQARVWRIFGDFILGGHVRHTKDGMPYAVGIMDP